MALFVSVRNGNVPQPVAHTVDWNLCFLCQSKKAEKLSDPQNTTRESPDQGYTSGYVSLADKLLAFEEIGKLPFSVNLKFLKDGKGLAENLKENKAKWHRSCYASCSSSRLEREKAKCRKRDLGTGKENESPSPLKSRRPDVTATHDRALEKIVQFLNDARLNLSEVAPVFYMTDLAKRYESHLEKMGITFDVHTTRLKERILAACPALEAIGSQGREIILTFKKDVDVAVRRLSSNEFNTNSVQATLTAAADIVRKDLFKMETYDWKRIDSAAQSKCTPQSLQSLLSMLLNGPGQKADKTCDFVVSNLAQIIRFHAVKRRRCESEVRRHDRSKECPLPVYVGLKLQKETRQRELIEVAHKLGISISYDRVKALMTDMANCNTAHYKQQGVVCPPSLRMNVFTTAAVDNIDHDTSSTTANDSFHGTAISLVQHPSELDETDSTWQPIPSLSTGRKIQLLPKEYTTVSPCFVNPKLAKFASAALQARREGPWSPSPFLQEQEWLERWVQGDEAAVNWSSFHAAKERGRVRVPTPSAMLPLFKEHAATPSMMLHAMTVAMAAMKHVNPGQVPVLVADQPLYAICQSLQRLLPDVVGEDKLFMMLGPLHIEMRLLSMLGEWAEGSGWTNLLVQAGILTQGRADSLLKGSHVTRTRHAHEVTAAVLYSLQKDAYDEDGNFVPFNEWREEKRRSVPQFAYTDTFLQNELTMLQFVRSLRTADFDLYVETLSLIMPWFFALDHHHYARWCSIQVRALVNLPQTHPDLAAQFRAGHFVGRNSSREFSGMGLDQLHEQQNAKLKGGGGMIGLTENPDALLRWILSGPDVAAVVEQFEEASDLLKTTDYHLHHNDTAAANSSFRQDFIALKKQFEAKGNPFLETGDELYDWDSGKVVVDQEAVQCMMRMEEIGREQYQLFTEERLEKGTKSVFDPIKKNKFKIMNTSAKKKSTTIRKISSLKSDVSLFSSLWISTHLRKADMKEFFMHENQALPPSLTDAQGLMRHTDKSAIVGCILPHQTDLSDARPAVDVTVIDGAALVHMIRPGVTTKVFRDYIGAVISYAQTELKKVSRVDLVFDVYLQDSLKNGTRNNRGQGIRMRVNLNAKTPSAWASFLRDSRNKEELFQLIAEQFMSHDWEGKTVVVTRQSECLTSQGSPGASLSPCNHEEADTRVILHSACAARQGLSKVMIRTVDSDIVVLAVWAVNEVPQIEELWVSLGVGGSHKFIPAHEIAISLGPSRCKVLPCFHALSGCDNTSSLATVGKDTAFKAWEAFPDATKGLLALCEGRVTDALPIMEKFVITMYCRSSNETSVNDARRVLFTGGRQLQSLPPTQDALQQHLKRVSYQAQVWCQSLVPMQNLPSPAQWGWTRSQDRDWMPKWITLQEASKACMQLVACKCKAECKSWSCRCLKNTKWKCSDLCRCSCAKSAQESDSSDDEV